MAAISARSLRSLTRISSSLGKKPSVSVKAVLQSRSLSSVVARSLVNECSLLKTTSKNNFPKTVGKQQTRILSAAISVIPQLELVGCGCDAESLEGVSDDDDTFSNDDDAIHRHR